MSADHHTYLPWPHDPGRCCYVLNPQTESSAAPGREILRCGYGPDAPMHQDGSDA